MLLWKLGVLEISLDKELTANCLLGTRTKPEEPMQAMTIKYGMTRVQLPLWLQQWYLMEWYVLCHSSQQTSVKCAEAAWNYIVREA